MLEKQMWMKFAPDIMTEWQQLTEEGRAVEAYKVACEEVLKLSETQDCEDVALALADLMAKAPMRADYPYVEPSAYEEIQEQVEGTKAVDWKQVLGKEELQNKIKGAWVGRISGCLLGKPMECLKSDVITTILKDSGNYPMNRYVDSREFPEGLAQKVHMDQFQSWQKCWVDKIGGKAPVDDDTNYTVLAMRLIDEYGTDFVPNDVLEAWMYWMPMFSACTAERVAYRNAGNGLYAPQTATHANPYREWIGAQIRGDFFGYLNPGNPKKAAWLAWKDASISHVKNGIYGEMLMAAMIAEAAVSDDLEHIIETGLKEIPTKSRLAHEVRDVLQWYREGVAEQEVFDRIHAKYDEYYQHDWCHTNSNAMIVVACLLYGQKDFGKTICLSVQTGFDTDCNGATAGSILGMVLGAENIPDCWADGFHSILRTSIAGYYEVTVDELADKTMELVLREA